MIFSTLCTGGGGADYGAKLAGMDHGFGVEYDPQIASIAWLNGFATIIADIRDVAYEDLTRPDWLHASTPCIEASVANKNAGETKLSIELAQAVCRAIEALKPDYFSLENVRRYATFKSYQMIKECLLANGYTYIDGILNAADYGTPQTRIRLFLVASRISTPKLPLPTHYDARSGAMNMLLKPWIGWYEAISDLLDDLPETQFAPWQLKRLPEQIKASLFNITSNLANVEPHEPAFTITSGHNMLQLKAVLVGGGNTNKSELRDRPVRNITDPAYTVTGSSDRDRAYLVQDQNTSNPNPFHAADRPAITLAQKSMPKAYVIDGQTGSYGTAMTIRDQGEPMYTVQSSIDRRPARAYVGRVVKLSPRCLARFNGIGDEYQLPTKQSLACKVLGNMVMPLVMKAIIESNIAR